MYSRNEPPSRNSTNQPESPDFVAEFAAAQGDNSRGPDFRATAINLQRIQVPRERDFPKPAVDKVYITSHATESGNERQVNEFHNALFQVTFASLQKRIENDIETLKEYGEDLDRRIALVRNRLFHLDEYLRKPSGDEECKPWRTLDKFGVGGFILIIILLLFMGLNTLATYLIGSGYIVFVENRILAYLLSSVNIGVAVLLKAGFSILRSEASRHLYMRWLFIVGLLSGLAWIGSFATLFPSIKPLEISLTVSDGTGGLDVLLESFFVAAQLIAEIAISAMLWIVTEGMYRRHGPSVILEKNPAYSLLARDLSDLELEAQTAGTKLAELNGCLESLEARRETYLARAGAELMVQRKAFTDGNFMFSKK